MSTLNVSLDRSRLAWLRQQARAMHARGWGKRDIARNLGVSPRTVQRYTAGNGTTNSSPANSKPGGGVR